ncbi:MAG: hypothetical protein P4M08_00540 [Oligoflexia bacterium]|nr:hypothetical protein [Oligoflexia bacterium]
MTRKASALKSTLVDLPVWYQPEAPFGSALRYLASLSPHFHWVGISVLKGKRLEPGPSLGDRKGGGKFVASIRDAAGKVLGQIEIDRSDLPMAELEKIVQRVADELGVLWPV